MIQREKSLGQGGQRFENCAPRTLPKGTAVYSSK